LALDSGPMSSPALLRQLDSDVSSRKGTSTRMSVPGEHRCKWCFTDPNGRCIDCRRPVCIRHKPISSVIERRVESNAIREWQGPLGITPYPHPGAFAIWVPFDETFLWLRVTFADSRVEESLLPLVDGANYSWAEAERLQSMLSSRGCMACRWSSLQDAIREDRRRREAKSPGSPSPPTPVAALSELPAAPVPSTAHVPNSGRHRPSKALGAITFLVVGTVISGLSHGNVGMAWLVGGVLGLVAAFIPRVGGSHNSRYP